MSKIPYFSGLAISGQLQLKNLIKNNDPYRVLTLDVNNNVNWSDYVISSGGTGGDLTNYYTKGQSESIFVSQNNFNWSNLLDRPTALSQFTNNLGNYGNWITAASGATLFQPLEDQRLSRNRDVRFSSITSTSYTSGMSGTGFRIDSFGNAEVSNLTVRNFLNLNEFRVNKISATNGSLAVSDAIQINIVTEETTSYKCEIKTDSGNIAVPFIVNDIVRCQIFNGRGVKYYLRRVTAVTASSFNLDKVALDGTDLPEVYDDVVRFGNTTDTSRQGLLYLTSSDSNAPYLDILDGVNSASLAGKTKVRLGRLDGITDASFGSLSGYGLYSQNAYITGVINVSGGNAQTIAGSETLVNNAKTDIIASATTLSTNAENAAKAYAEAQDDLSETIIKSYADGIVSDEEARAIADAQAKLLESKAYSETKASEAQANAIASSTILIDEATEIAKDYSDEQLAISAAATLLTASSTSFNQSETARIAAVNAAANYTNLTTSASATQTEINAAATALTLANQKRDEAIATAEAARIAFANSLGSLAFESMVEVAKLGSSIIQGGFIKTNLIDVDVLRATLINATQIVIDGGAATTTQLNTAYNNALAYTDTRKKITAISGGKILNNPYSISSDPVAAALVIHTNIQFNANYMTSIKIKGYNYLEGNNDIDLTIGFYAYSSGMPTGIFHQTGFVNKGTYLIDRVRLAHNTGNNTVSIIIGNDSQNWSYPKLNVENCTITYTTPPDSFADGWTGTFTNDYTGLSVITDISGTIAESTAGSQARATTALNSAVSQAVTLANNAQSASTNYTNQQAAYEREVAKAYSDGKLTTAESELLAEMASKLVESKNYADSSASAAQSAAITAASAASQSYTNSQIAISEGNVLNSAANTAQAKSDAAYTNAVNASNAYAVTQASAYSSQAEINSAANASVLATNAYNNSVAAAASAQASLVASLKSLAYQDVVEISKLGSTVIVGGMIKTDLISADYIRGSIVNADYIYGLNITARTLAATSGTIGNWTIGTDKLYSGIAGLDYIELTSGSAPQVYMHSSTQGFGEYSMLNPDGIFIMSNGVSLPTPYSSYNAVAAYKLRNSAPSNSVSLYLSAPSSSNALICDGNAFFSNSVSFAGSIFTGIGNQGITTTQRWQIYVGATLRTHEFRFVNGLLCQLTNVS
jgi:hypothetical protein